MSWLSNATGINVDVNKQVGLTPSGKKYAGEINLPNAPRQVAQPNPQEEILTEQQKAYKDYMTKLPSFQKKMAEGLAQQSMATMTGQQRGVEQRNVSRGLGYGALNESMKEQVRAQNQQGLASAIEQGNLGLLGLGEQMQAGIVATGGGMQADLQNKYNQIYSQQMAEMQRRSSQLGGLLGAAGTIAGLYFSGGNPAAGMAGGAVGSGVASQI